MAAIRIVDVTDEATFGLVPPCADPGFDHRSCDYWEDADRGSKAARLAWLEPAASPPPPKPRSANPFAIDADDEPIANPFAPPSRTGSSFNPFATDDDLPDDNPFAPSRPARPTIASDAPRKLGLLGRGLAIFGSYAKVLLVDEVAAAYAQFGPLSAYPRAQRLRDLYPAAAGCAAARGHHLHRDDGGGPPPRPRPAARRSGLRRPRGPRVRCGRGVSRTRRPARRHERRDAGVLAHGRVRGRGRRRALPRGAPGARLTAAAEWYRPGERETGRSP